MKDDYPFIREIRSPLTDEQLQPLDSRCRVVQFAAPLSADEIARLSRFHETYPHVPLRIYGHYSQTPDLSFLRAFPFLKGFQADVYQLQNLDGLSYLSENLEFLGLGQTKRRFSLKPLAKFKNLKDLYIERHSKDLSVVSGLSHLRYLTLRSITLPGLSILIPLQQLRSLALKLGGTRDLALLPELKNLRYLELWMIRGLTDLMPIGQMNQLRYLFLQDLKQVNQLPSFKQLSSLMRCHVENLKGLQDLCPIATASNLRELLVVNMPHIPVEHFSCFKSHPTLQNASIGLGSKRRNEEVSKLIGLTSVSDIKPIEKYIED
jgi:hypothetical protein